MSKADEPPGGRDGNSIPDDWEDILSLRVDGEPEEEASKGPVRLSSLRPPKGSTEDQLPTAVVPLRSGERWDAGETTSEGERKLSRRLSESEHARRAAEARVVELDRELGDLRARMAYEREAAAQAASGGGPADASQLERLRAELVEAHEIIRAIEEAYLAGENRLGRTGLPEE